MKKYLLFFFALLFIKSSFSQKKVEDIKVQADSAIKSFHWDIQKSERGTLMFLDVPYTKDGQNSAEYLTLTIAKDKSKNRPDFISVIIPSNIVQSNGIFIKFAKTVKTNENPGWKMELEKGNPVRVNFEKCNDETCNARIISGYIVDEKTTDQLDIFQKFLDFDHVLFLFIYPDGSHKSVAIPLFSFKEQYKQL